MPAAPVRARTFEPAEKAIEVPHFGCEGRYILDRNVCPERSIALEVRPDLGGKAAIRERYPVFQVRA